MSHSANNEQLKKLGTRVGSDFILKSRAKLYTRTEIFAEYIRTVRLLNPNELRTLGEFADEEVILLMNDCPNHVTEAVIVLLRDAQVQVTTWAPYIA
jgi:hypothetical protein